MKMLLSKEGMRGAIERAKARGEEENLALLERERLKVNELVCRISGEKKPRGVLQSMPQDLLDAVVVRYLRNREIFMKTFPDGIEGVEADPVAIWSSIMISPGDEGPAS
jgi:hypothetical protein